MPKEKSLTKKQYSVIEDILNGLDEAEIIQKHKISFTVYHKWLGDPDFARCMDNRISFAYRKSDAYLAKSSYTAASYLVKLAGSGSTETARKACLDIIAMQKQINTKQNKDNEETLDKTSQNNEHKEQQQLSSEAASKLLAALAEEK